MTHTPSSQQSVWASIGFVPLWSSGVIVGALALRHGPPFAVTAARFAVATALLSALALEAVVKSDGGERCRKVGT